MSCRKLVLLALLVPMVRFSLLTAENWMLNTKKTEEGKQRGWGTGHRVDVPRDEEKYVNDRETEVGSGSLSQACGSKDPEPFSKDEFLE